MIMATTTRTQNRYDHRLRELVQTTRDVSYAVQCGVPRSTARGWLNAPSVEVVTLDSLNMDATQLQREVLQLQTRIRKLIALLRVLLAILKAGNGDRYNLHGRLRSWGRTVTAPTRFTTSGWRARVTMVLDIGEQVVQRDRSKPITTAEPAIHLRQCFVRRLRCLTSLSVGNIASCSQPK